MHLVANGSPLTLSSNGPWIEPQKFGFGPATGSFPNLFNGLPRGTGRMYSAVAARVMSTVLMNIDEKNWSAEPSRITTRSFRVDVGSALTVMVMSFWPLTKPLRSAAARATVRAVVRSGIHTTPARDA